MANATLKLLQQLNDGQVYADPADPGFTTRFKTTSAQKSLNGQRTTNYVSEIIINDDHTVVIGSQSVVDAVSVRLRVSGAVESMARIKEIVNNLGAQLQDWTDEDVFIGFAPTTVPENPHA